MKMPPKMGARPPMEDEEDDDMAAIGALMSSESPEMEAPEQPQAGGDPATIVADLKAKLAELEASLSQL